MEIKIKYLKVIFIIFFFKGRDKVICFFILILVLFYYRLEMVFMDGKNYFVFVLWYLVVKGFL